MKLKFLLLILFYGQLSFAQKGATFFSAPKLFVHHGKFVNQTFFFNTDGTYYFAQVSAGPYKRSYGCYKIKKDRIYLNSTLQREVLNLVYDTMRHLVYKKEEIKK